MTAIDLTPEERALLTSLLLEHRDNTPPGSDHDHYFLRKKLKLTFDEWNDPNREILT